MIDSRDISSLTTLSVDLQTTETSNLSSLYNPYFLYVETRNDNDIPEEFQYNLYYLYNAGIDSLFENGGDVIIGEEISSRTQILCTQNAEIIINELDESENDTIEYEKIVQFASILHDRYSDNTRTSSDISAEIFNWLSEMLEINFVINENPENSDDTNLILTQAMKNYIQPMTESILRKIFKNLMQLVRVLHDYRLYGPGATIFAGSSGLNTAAQVGNWSALPESCWTEYSGNYVVGKTVYNGEEVGDVETGTIKNSRYNIAPYTSYGIDKHTHNVTLIKSNIPSSFSIERNIWKSFESGYSSSTHGAAQVPPDSLDGTFVPWTKAIQETLIGGKGMGYFQKGSDTGAVKKSSSWSYSWKTNSNCKLTADSSMTDKIFDESLTVLPTYSSYVWKWTGNDTIDILNPWPEEYNVN